MCVDFFFLMIRRPPRSTLDRSSAASDVYKRQADVDATWEGDNNVLLQQAAKYVLDNARKFAKGKHIEEAKTLNFIVNVR